jgi:hypothetical protein
MMHTAGLVCLISTVNGRIKKEEEEAFLGRPALVAGTYQTLSYLFLSFDIHGTVGQIQNINIPMS